MSELAINQAIFFHKIINLFLIFLIFCNFFSTLFVRDFVRLNKILWFLNPLFFGFLGINLLSGISIWAMQFYFSFEVIFMLISNIFIIASEIFCIKKLRRARAFTNSRNIFIKWNLALKSLYFFIFIAFFIY